MLAIAALTASVGAIAVPAAAQSPQWQVHLLPLPDGHPDATGFVTGTDGRGNYSGMLAIEGRSVVVTWTRSRVTVWGTPEGTNFAAVWDQNKAGTVTGTALADGSGESVPFLLDGPSFRVLPLPAGYSEGSADAINNRGDVLGAVTGSDGQSKPVVWWAGRLDRPELLDVPGWGLDIDDDGTILVDGLNEPSRLFRDGKLIDLAVPAGYDHIYAHQIKNGMVIGHASSPAQPAGQGILWRTPSDPWPLQGSESTSHLNRFGLVVGREPIPTSHNGPLATWWGPNFAGRLPMPAGHNGSAGAVGEDGAIVGWVSTGPLDEGGRPAVWRLF